MPAPVTITREQSRQVDRRAVEEYGMSSLVLMENAGRGVVDKIFELGFTGRVLVCCGKGNNAGDGFVIARHLDLRGAPVTVSLWSEVAELSADARVNHDILARSCVPIARHGALFDAEALARETKGAGLIVDALLGTGARGAARFPFDRVIVALNASSIPIIAVDLPSGFDCDLGAIDSPIIRACHTCTFVAAKRGFLTRGSSDYIGQAHVLDIGAPRKLVEEILREAAADPPPSK